MSEEQEPFWERNLILRVLCGSRAYGLDTPESDTDSRGVCIPPKEKLLGLTRFEQHESPGCDHVIYSLEKFARLALDGNPNIIETLFTDRRHVLSIDAYGERLVAVRERMLSRRVGERFMGYALSQRKRIEGHHRWLTDPPESEPKPATFGGRDEEGLCRPTPDGRMRWPSAQAQKAYKTAHKKWTQYVSWRANRNPKRAALEDEHGYDTKHAQHLCRLLTMGEEILRDGEVRVHRPDAEFLRSVRAGALSYDELTAWIDERVERLPRLTATSPLPEEPDRAGIEALVVELQAEYLFG